MLAAIQVAGDEVPGGAVRLMGRGERSLCVLPGPVVAMAIDGMQRHVQAAIPIRIRWETPRNSGSTYVGDAIAWSSISAPTRRKGDEREGPVPAPEEGPMTWELVVAIVAVAAIAALAFAYVRKKKPGGA
jgi:hypothetical protein